MKHRMICPRLLAFYYLGQRTVLSFFCFCFARETVEVGKFQLVLVHKVHELTSTTSVTATRHRRAAAAWPVDGRQPLKYGGVGVLCSVQRLRLAVSPARPVAGRRA